MAKKKRAESTCRKRRGSHARCRPFVEPLEPRLPMTATPFGALPQDTAEFLLGDVQVTVVLMESSDDPNDLSFLNDNSETWTDSSKNAVKAKVTEGLDWWVDTLAGITDKHHLNFNIDFTYADNPVPTPYEPITRPSTDYQFWIYDFLRPQLETTTGFFTTDVRDFNNQAREANNANWGFTIFVINDENDSDHRFAPGGLDRAFAFPGGLFLVTLASRPASTITHETGHIFWALDEYQNSGSSYTATRGYYNTQNENAFNNPVFTSGQQNRAPSIMDRGACGEGGGLLCDAFQQQTSAQSSLEMLGWRDSDGDGVFDVLDVPHTLSGTGEYDPATGLYRFRGESSVQTLPNLNPRISASATESMQSDITINNVSRAEYRIDGGAWQTGAVYDAYRASIDLSIGVPASANTIEFRTIDDVTGVTSPVFQGTLVRTATTLMPGLNGFAFSDADQDGGFETGESGLAGRMVRLVDAGSQPITLASHLNPDDHSQNTAVSNVVAGATLTAIGGAVADAEVFVRSVNGNNVFSACTFQQGNSSCGIYSNEWTSNSRQLRIDFASPVTTISIDAQSNAASEYGRLDVYDANDNLLDRYTTAALAEGESETMTVSRATPEIAYAIARGYADTSPLFDNLRFGPEATAMTDANGAYSIPYLPPGTYRVEMLVPNGSQATNGSIQTVDVAAGEAVQIDFGFIASSNTWQNPANVHDVNNDTFVSPIDALQIINILNTEGSHTLTSADVPPPFVDVNGDGFVAPIDALIVINFISSGGEPESEATGEHLAENTGSEAILATRAPSMSFVPLASHNATAEQARPESEPPSQPLAGAQDVVRAFAELGIPEEKANWAITSDASEELEELFDSFDLTALSEDVAAAWNHS
ncbi:MAG: hypothetical protein CMJ64_03700 [Planctomycetaceae bacterium]|nr:hypothetical protein [Planctomycetaceae bacterium]